MYGSESDTASKFTYTYQAYEEGNGVKLGYNDWTAFNSTDGNIVKTKYEDPDDTNSKVLAKYVIVPELSLGEKHFYVDLKNSFGYKARFYFSAISTLNPQIESLNTYTVQEGQTIAIGSKFIEMTPVKDGSNVVFEEFSYNNANTEGDSDKYFNVIAIGDKNANDLIVSTMLYVTANGKQYKRNVINTSFVESDNYKIVYVNKNQDDDGKPDWEPVEGGDSEKLDDSIIEKVKVTALISTTDKDSPLGTYSLTYGYAAQPEVAKLKQLYTESSTFNDPEYKTGETSASVSDVEVTLNGITAYGYKTEQGGIDVNGLESSINQVFVKKVDFYLGDKLLGTSNNTGETPIITNANYTFLDKGTITSGNTATYEYITPAGHPDAAKTGYYVYSADAKLQWDLGKKTKVQFKLTIEGYKGDDLQKEQEYTIAVANYRGKSQLVECDISGCISDYKTAKGIDGILEFKISDETITSTGKSSPGVGADENNNYTVPTIDGIHFGTGNAIQNVLMRITLVDENENTHVVSEYVTLEKNADTTDIFNNNVLDGNSPTKAKTTIVLNDTLEIKLQPGDSITYAISDREEVDSKLTVSVPQASKVTFKLYKDGASEEDIEETRPIVIDNTGDSVNAMTRTIDIA